MLTDRAVTIKVPKLKGLVSFCHTRTSRLRLSSSSTPCLSGAIAELRWSTIVDQAVEQAGDEVQRRMLFWGYPCDPSRATG